jgi:transcription elongation factor GreA
LAEPSRAVTLLDAVGLYVSSLKTKAAGPPSRQELLRFAQWCGSDRIIGDIRPPDIEEYGTQAAGSAARRDAPERLREVRQFLTFAHKKGLIQQNLARYLRVPKAKLPAAAARSRNGPATIEITAEGQAQIESELEALRSKRGPIAAEIRRAAADKDVRENAPLEAAREQLGQLESRIGELEKALESAVTVERSGPSKTVRLGSKVVLREVDSGRETAYTIVGALEADPLGGKISDVSPVGKALMNQAVGREVSVTTPRGLVKYLIKRVAS